MTSNHSRLTEVLNRTRTALFGPQEGQQTEPKREPEQIPFERIAGGFTEPPAPRIAPAIKPPSAAEVIEGLTLSAGAWRVWNELHRLALEVHQHRGHTRTPDALTFHLPAVILAALVGYTERHTRNLLHELEDSGVLAYGGHVSKVGVMRRYSGTLFCVALRPGARPRLRFWDYQADWRPDFAADYYGEKGAWREVQEVISEPLTYEGKRARLWEAAKAWAVGSRTQKTPLKDGSEMRAGAGFSELSSQVAGLLGLHPAKRHRAVSEWAASMAALLGEPHRLKQWCGAIYRAIAAENEGRQGLSRLAQEIYRFGAEIRAGEGETMKNAGAVLAARLKL